MATGPLLTPNADAGESKLWGIDGDKWTPESRLPDFSWAGYRHGETPPNVPLGVSVKTFGAKGDGKTDDTKAFLKALAQVDGAIEVPSGRYLITKILEINRSGVVLRGVGPNESILVCPVPLQEIKPNWGATTGGRKTSNYSWSGGIVWIKGHIGKEPLTAITGSALRGATSLQVSSTEGLPPGMRVRVRVSDTPENNLARSLYGDAPGEAENLNGSTTAHLPCRITAIDGNTIQIDRPLRFEVRPEWQPELLSFEPTVSECGVENLGFEFPENRYEGHFTEAGHNALSLQGVADCWARNLEIINADSGIFVSANFCSVQGVTFISRRPTDKEGNTGHHGVYFGNDDNLFSDFDYQTRFIHDISVSRCAGNVFENGQGVDLCLDHHRRAPYGNLFTNIDAGLGTRLWKSGGGAGLGKHCAAWGTFWNIRAKQPLSPPPTPFAPELINLVGLATDQPGTTDPSGKWFEVFPGSSVEPANIHQTQRKRRLHQTSP